MGVTKFAARTSLVVSASIQRPEVANTSSVVSYGCLGFWLVILIGRLILCRTLSCGSLGARSLSIMG